MNPKFVVVLSGFLGVAFSAEISRQYITTSTAVRHEPTEQLQRVVTIHVGRDQHFVPRPARPDIGNRPILSSPRITNWGEWGPWASCDEYSVVVGMRLKTEQPQGDGDDTALNAIRLLCSARGPDTMEIESAEQKWGRFGSTFLCPGQSPAVGFQLRVEGPQGNGDDTATNNLRLLCVGGSTIEGDGLSWGDWSEAQRCRAGQVLCGFRTQVEPDQGNGDDTALNNVDMVCCDL